MKIGQDIRTQMDTQKVRQNSDQRQSFDRIVQSQTQQLKQSGLEKLMKNITLQGDKLGRYRTFRELAKFKRMIKSFLQETVSHGLDLQKSASFSFDGHHNTLALVKEVDAKLIELTEQLMDEERKHVDLLGLIGEIKGLLVNIYT